jgi:hypothetical protein
MSSLYLTFDTDWAPDFVLDYCFNLVGQKGIKATIFATGSSPVLTKLNDRLFEVGIHPRFSKSVDVRDEIIRLKKIFPRATSLRSHSLCHSSRFFPIFREMNISSTSNYLASFCKNLEPIIQPFGILEYPIYFMDDAYVLMYGEKDKYQLSSLSLDSAGVKVFAFHPIHVFLNTNSLERYEQQKKHPNFFGRLEELVNKDIGIRDLFVSLIEYVSSRSFETLKLSEGQLR